MTARNAFRRYLLAWALLVLGSTLCLPSAARTDGQLQPVRVQLKWTHQFQFAGYYAAIHQGYYRDAGFEVTLIEHQPGLGAIDQLIGGRVDYAVGDSGVLLYRATGVPLVALAAIFQQSPSILLTLEESGIETLADLRGKRIMLLGGYLNAELMSMLATAGIGADDFTLLPADTDVRALIDGRTEAYNAYTTNEPFALSRRGIAHRAFSPSDYGVDFYADILVTTEGRVAADADGVRRFTEATLRGWRYAVDNPEEVVDLILEHYNTQARSRDHLLFEAREAIRLILPNVVPIGFINEERFARIAKVFRDQGQLANAVDLNEFIYRPDDDRLFEVLARHRLQIAAAVIALFALALLSHILRLRAQVRARTRELDAARECAEIEARTDALTGLPNRRSFLETLHRDLARAERRNEPLTLMSLDIDHFKTINDRYGHAAGDLALQRTAETLAAHVRSGDMAARIGGEEFAVACHAIGGPETLILAERLRAAVEATEIVFEDQHIALTVSIGVAEREATDDVGNLLRKADLALYVAKQQGRNRVCTPSVGPPETRSD
ncbi:GGDEF domain-containing protein [Pseudazoarcus pumilus]|uniref:diguanylate cyclase n=1 Tax=Pseudazoarcus pumilus TaxID=2067960 RepID=A0A2I6S6T8_9RHOO|nr:GGDEF domain-containing protein [Pseudazoarcus pumilus]AUN94962.1 GGDEF domain-containing protein [Pseudazoarcus pumilus]